MNSGRYASRGRSLEYREPTKPLHPLVYALRKRRYELGISAAELSERIGYEAATVQGWEYGASKPTLYSIEVWATGLGMKLALEDA